MNSFLSYEVLSAKIIKNLKDVVDKFKASPQGRGGAKVSKEQIEDMVRAMVQNTKIRYEKSC